jgi:hypothetical protein
VVSLEIVVVNFPGVTVPSTIVTNKHIKKVMSTGSLLNKKLAEKCSLLTKDKLDEIGTRLERMSQKSLRCLAQETDSSKLSAAKVTKLFKLRLFKATTVHGFICTDMFFPKIISTGVL